MRIFFSKANHKFTFKIRGYKHTYRDAAKKFIDYGLVLPDAQTAKYASKDLYDCFRFELTGAVDCAKAAIVSASNYYFSDDDRFCDWVENAKYSLDKLTDDECDREGALFDDLQSLLNKKYKQLTDCQQQLNRIASKLTVDCHSYGESEPNLENINLIIEQNNKLYQQLILAAREKSTTYNAMAQSANKAADGDRTKMLPIMDAETEFPLLIEQKYDYDFKKLCELNRATISSREINILVEKVNRLFDYIAKRPVAEEAITGTQVDTPESQQAELLHSFNSKQSPLLAIIYSSDIGNKQKEFLIDALAQQKPYRFSHQGIEQRKNIEIGGKVRIKNKTRYSYGPKGSPLHHAVISGSNKMVEILVNKGADLSATGTFIAIPQIDYRGIAALHLAAAESELTKVELLLAAGANVNAVNKMLQTPLHVTSDRQALKTLLAAGADTNQQDQNGQTPLHFAVMHGHPEIVDILLEQPELDIGRVDNLGNTALHIATATCFDMTESYGSLSKAEKATKKNQNLTIIRTLIEHNANVNATNHRGYTPAHMAVMDDRSTSFQKEYHKNVSLLDFQFVEQQLIILSQTDADFTIQSIPLQNDNHAYEHDPAPGTTPLLALYSKNFDGGNREQRRTLAEQRLQVATMLIEKGSDPKLSFEYDGRGYGYGQRDGYTLLHLCARYADVNAFAYFCSLGLDPNYQADSRKETPFHVFLSRHGGDYSWRDKGTPQITKSLFDCGVDVTKTKNTRIEINRNSLNKAFGGSIPDTTIIKLFKHDNLIRRHATKMGLKVDDNNYREVIEAVYQDFYENQFGRHHRSVEVDIPLTALENAFHSSFTRPCFNMIALVQDQEKVETARQAGLFSSWQPEKFSDYPASSQEKACMVQWMGKRIWAPDGESWKPRFTEASFPWAELPPELIFEILDYLLAGEFNKPRVVATTPKKTFFFADTKTKQGDEDTRREATRITQEALARSQMSR